eukprot:Em0001g2362a
METVEKGAKDFKEEHQDSKWQETETAAINVETSERSEKERSDSKAEKETSGRNEKEMREKERSDSSEKETSGRYENEMSGRSEQKMSEGSEKEMSRSEKKDQEKLLYQDVMKYIMERAYRVDAEKNWKKTIRRSLYSRMISCIPKVMIDRRRWVFDEEDQKRVTEACHDDKQAVDPGIMLASRILSELSGLMTLRSKAAEQPAFLRTLGSNPN